MVAISFSKNPEFPEMIRKGIKDQTIRPLNEKRYEQIKRIRKLQLYWKQRTKECFKIADAELTEIFKIKFVKKHLIFKKSETEYFNRLFYPLEPMDIHEIVTRDGFDEFQELWEALENTYGNIEDMIFMVIRFKVTNIPDYPYEYAKKIAKKTSEDDGLISDEMMDTLDEMAKELKDELENAEIQNIQLQRIDEEILRKVITI